MTKPRKPRTDSTDNILRVFAGADTEIAPPDHVPMTDAAWPFWHSVTGEFAAADWTPHALEVAALMCLDMAALEAEQRTLRDEGSVLTNSAGNPIMNPRVRIVAGLISQKQVERRRSRTSAPPTSPSNSGSAPATAPTS